MKELETHLKLESRERIELNVKKKQKIEYVLQGRLIPNAGHFIWELNEETGEIRKAEFKKDTAILLGALPPDELMVKPDCIYIPALNAENAKKKYLKNKNQDAYYVKPALMSLSDITFKP